MLHSLLTAAARLFVKLLPTHSGPIAAPISVSNNPYHQTLNARGKEKIRYFSFSD